MWRKIWNIHAIFFLIFFIGFNDIIILTFSFFDPDKIYPKYQHLQGGML